MPVRDEQEFESKRQQIMKGALEVFAHKGFEKATNKDIAQAAGIGSPGLIYHYFKDKQDLFERMLEHHAPGIFMLIQNEEQLLELPLEELLPRFARALMQVYENLATVALLKILLSEALRYPAVGEIIGRAGPGRVFVFFRRYFARHMDAGTMRRMDPNLAIRCFIGPMMASVILRDVLRVPGAHDLSDDAVVAAAIDVFLHGALIAPVAAEERVAMHESGTA